VEEEKEGGKADVLDSDNDMGGDRFLLDVSNGSKLLSFVVVLLLLLPVLLGEVDGELEGLRLRAVLTGRKLPLEVGDNDLVLLLSLFGLPLKSKMVVNPSSLCSNLT
tara:strand:+ start:614 stop:934 length:321 start_codon:yes stop_codon:yes gene_type:complete